MRNEKCEKCFCRKIFAATEKGKTMRLIDADALLERFKSMKLNCKANYAIAKNIGKIVFETSESTVDICSEEVKRSLTVDAVPVVRCKDCKHYMTIHCTCDGCCISDYWYCADGERKDNDGKAN